MPDTRTQDGTRSTIALLDALTRNDVAAFRQAVLDSDPEATIFCLASAWVSLTEYAELDAKALLQSMREATEPTGGQR